MTVETEDRSVDRLGNGATRNFPFSFRFYADSHILVSSRDSSDDPFVEISTGSYTLTRGSGDASDGYLGGTITYPSDLGESPIASGVEIRIERWVPFTQTGIDLNTVSGFDPRAIEREFDLTVMRQQQLLGYTPVVPPDLETVESLAYIAGNPYVADDIVVSDGVMYVCRVAHTLPARDPETYSSNSYWARLVDITVGHKDAVTYYIPTTFPTLDAAINEISKRVNGRTRDKITLMIEDGHQPATGLRLENGDFSAFEIAYAGDLGTPGSATVTLSPSFVGVDNSDLPGEASAVFDSSQNLFVFSNCLAPTIACKFDMDSPRGDPDYWGHGIYAQNSRVKILEDCGVINTGVCGLYCQGSRIYALNTVWSGSGGPALRIQQGSNATFQGCTVDAGQADADVRAAGSGDSMVFISRASVVNLIDATLTNSGADGVEVHRAYLAMTAADCSGAAGTALRAVLGADCRCSDSDFSGAGDDAIVVSQGSHVALEDCDLSGCGGLSIVMNSGGGSVFTEGATGKNASPGVLLLADVSGVDELNYPGATGVIYSDSAGPLQRMTLHNVGTFSATGVTSGKLLNSATTMDSSRTGTSSANHNRFYNANGLVGSVESVNSQTNFNTSSDGRLKANQTPSDKAAAAARVSAMLVKDYDWLSGVTGELTGETGRGLIAQELELLAPYAVRAGSIAGPGDPEFIPYAIDYSKLVPDLILAFQHLSENL